MEDDSDEPLGSLADWRDGDFSGQWGDIPTPDDAQSLPMSSDRYEVGTLLGKGGMGEVHAVRDQLLGRVVAKKALGADPHPAAAMGLMREARIAARLELRG